MRTLESYTVKDVEMLARRARKASLFGLSAALLCASAAFGADPAHAPAPEGSPLSLVQYEQDPDEPAGYAPDPRDERVKVLAKGTSARAARKTAVEALPLGQLTPEGRELADDVLKSVHLFRQMPTLRFDVDPKVYLFFLGNPDVAVSIWQAMEISKFQLTQTTPTRYDANAGDGSKGFIEVLLRGTRHNLIYCEGEYQSPLLSKPIKALALIHVETSYAVNDAGKTAAIHRANLFVNFPSQTVRAAAKVVSPVSNAMMDRNFYEISLFVQMFSLAMARQPGWVEHIAEKMQGISPQRAQQLVDLTADVYVASRKHELGDDIPLDEITPPVRTAESQSPAQK